MRDMSFKPRAGARTNTPQQIAGAIPTTPIAKRRTLLLTGAVAFITVAGALIGATLKSKEQVQEKEVCSYATVIILITFLPTTHTHNDLQTIRERSEVNEADQIALLEGTRGQLLGQKMQLQKKINELRERQKRKVKSDNERERLMAGAGRSVER